MAADLRSTAPPCGSTTPRAARRAPGDARGPRRPEAWRHGGRQGPGTSASCRTATTAAAAMSAIWMSSLPDDDGESEDDEEAHPPQYSPRQLRGLPACRRRCRGPAEGRGALGRLRIGAGGRLLEAFEYQHPIWVHPPVCEGEGERGMGRRRGGIADEGRNEGEMQEGMREARTSCPAYHCSPMPNEVKNGFQNHPVLSIASIRCSSHESIIRIIRMIIRMIRNY